MRGLGQPDLTLEEAIRFLNEKLGNQACSVCGVLGWYIPNEGRTLGAGDLAPTNIPQTLFVLSGIDGKTGFTFLPMVCRNCKHTVLFDAAAIKDEVLRNG